MRVIDIWRTKGKPTVSFELFPARNPKAAEGLGRTIDTLAGLRPDFVSVTFGAGGSTREGSYDLVRRLMKEKGLETVAYFACFGLGPEELVSVLDGYRDLGVENILAVRGDPPRDSPDYRPHPDALAHASDLLAFVRPRYDFCLAAAGYPEGHVEAPSREKDLEYLKLKVEKGAEFIVTNYFYDNRFYFDFVERCRNAGITVPILPGVMPIFSVKMMRTLAALCGAAITDEVVRGMAALPEGDAAALAAFGAEFATRQCRELLQRGAPGVHIYTMDRSMAAVEIVGRLRAEGLL